MEHLPIVRPTIYSGQIGPVLLRKDGSTRHVSRWELFLWEWFWKLPKDA